ncbi:MAG: PaaI family thioesterase [Actinomycetota bacterium]
MPAERLADAVRRLIRLAVATDAPPEVLEEAVAELEAVADRLESHPRRGAKEPILPDLKELQATFSADPVIGVRNPIAPPVEAWVEGHDVHGRVTFERPYEGPPGYVHGAVIAAVFDLMCGLANLAAGNAGMTGTLTIKYLRPTPLDREIHIECRQIGAEGRKTFIGGRFLDGSKVTAEVEAVFVSLMGTRAAEYFQRKA